MIMFYGLRLRIPNMNKCAQFLGLSQVFIRNRQQCQG